MNHIVHKDLSYKITGFCFETQKELGRFCREKQYADTLEKILLRENINYRRELRITDSSDEFTGNQVDFVIENKVILDAKAKKFITKEDYFQMQRYLKSANLELGLIVNFRATYLKPKRILNSAYSNHSDVN